MPNVRRPKRRAALRILRIALCASCAIRPAGTQEFNRPAWIDDYTMLKHELENRYANLAWFASPEGGVDLPTLDRHTLALLAAAKTDDDAKAAILGFVRSFHDGHFSQTGGGDAAGAAANRAVAPLNPTYHRDDAASGCAALNFVASDPPQFSLPFETLAGFKLYADGISTPFRAAVLQAGEGHARVGIVRIPAFEELVTFASCLAGWKRDDVWDSTGTLRTARLRQAVQASWYSDLADILRRFARDSVAAVAVDVGNNSGGDDSGDIAARLFTIKPLHSSAMWMSQDSSAAWPYFNEEITALTSAQQRDPSSTLVKDALDGFLRERDRLKEPCSMSWVWAERRSWIGTACKRLVPTGSAGGPLSYLSPDAARDSVVARELHWPAAVAPFWGSWTGPLYVITDARTYSSAEMFAAVLRNNDAAKTIGARTGGDGCGFVDNRGLVILPHSGLRFRVPNCVRLRADGSDEVAGVSPDFPVLPQTGESGRARALRLVQTLTADLSRPR